MNLGLVCTTCFLLGSSLGSAGSPPQRVDQESVLERVASGDNQAILELGNAGNTNAIPVLEKWIAEGIHVGDPNKEKRELAVKAMEKIGAENYYKERISRLSSQQTTSARRAIDNAFTVLSCLRTKDAVKIVAFFLFDDSSTRTSYGDQLFSPNRSVAAMALERMITDPSAPQTSRLGTEKDVKKWRDWWLTNKSKYE